MLPYFVLFFAVYSVIGWLYETALCSFEERKAVNRGFLMGPYCPIYGCGALLFILLLGSEGSPLLIFFLGAFVACAIEYSTSAVMERLFHARWWDYSKFRFNLNGRICLGAAMIFGAFAVLLIKLLHPAVSGILFSLPKVIILAMSAAFTVVFILDLFFTLRGFDGFHQGFPDNGELSRQEARLLKAFPSLMPSRDSIAVSQYREALKKSSVNNKKKRKTS